MFEIFEHTADLGLRMEAPTLEALLTEAAAGLAAVLVDDPETVQPRERREIALESDDPAYLLFDWLNELLYLFETERFLPASVEVRIDDGGLHANVRGERADSDRHALAHEVKAVTYHRLEAERTPRGWRGQVILDI